MFFPHVFLVPNDPKRSQDACVDGDELNQIQAMQGRGVSNASQDGMGCDSRRKPWGYLMGYKDIIYIYINTQLYIDMVIIYIHIRYIYIYALYIFFCWRSLLHPQRLGMSQLNSSVICTCQFTLQNHVLCSLHTQWPAWTCKVQWNLRALTWIRQRCHSHQKLNESQPQWLCKKPEGTPLDW